MARAKGLLPEHPSDLGDKTKSRRGSSQDEVLEVVDLQSATQLQQQQQQLQLRDQQQQQQDSRMNPAAGGTFNTLQQQQSPSQGKPGTTVNANTSGASDASFSVGSAAMALWPKSKFASGINNDQHGGNGNGRDNRGVAQSSSPSVSEQSSPSRDGGGLNQRFQGSSSPNAGVGGGGLNNGGMGGSGAGTRMIHNSNNNNNNNNNNTMMIASLSQSIGQVLSQMPLGNSTPQDMINLGLGMGLALMQSGALQGFNNGGVGGNGNYNGGPSSYELGANTTGVDMAGGGGGGYDVARASMFPSLSEDELNSIVSGSGSENSAPPFIAGQQRGPEPIGLVKPTISFNPSKALNHVEEGEQYESKVALLHQPLNPSEQAQQLLVTPSLPTDTPDIRMKFQLTSMQPLNADEAVREKIPVLVYPELSTASNTLEGFKKHESAGIGTSFELTKEAAMAKTRVDGNEALQLHASLLPVGFFDSIGATHVASQEVDYLPQVPNLPQSRTVGRVRPRSVAADWLAIAFDPWSAGKNPLNTEFIAALSSKIEMMSPSGGSLQARETETQLREAAKSKDAFINLEDEEGATELQKLVTQGQMQEEEFKKVASMCRHAKFAEVEEMMSQPDWRLPLDYQDTFGNTLLHVVTQNGNKRLVKLCLRRAAPINAQNLQGQTPLHFAFGYGYTELGEYLIRKGADDSLRNNDGLTCYEGIAGRDLQEL
jgi:hypothetical protein